MYWGYHLMLDCSRCNENVKDKDQIYLFVKELIDAIDMVAHGEPIIEYLLPGEVNAGYSLMQLITTSNICAHFVDSDNSAYIDIFSCKEFDKEIAQAVVKKYFGPERFQINYLTRQAN
jgi:S-adenosylmethionine/arginine decarboxylase-like enzyme